MTDHPTPAPAVTTGAPQVLPTARPSRRTVLRGPAAAVGALAVVALGAGVLLLPGGSAAADGLGARAALQSFSVPAAHPVDPEVSATTDGAPAAPRVRDPFRPLLSQAEGTSVPAQTSTGSTASSDSTASSGSTVSSGSTASSGTPAVAAPPLAPQIPQVSVPSSPSTGTGAGASADGRKIVLSSVEPAGDSFAAVLSIDGEKVRVEVGGSFGGDLLLLSLQQGPVDGQWTAVVQAGQGEPFDVVTGTPTRIP